MKCARESFLAINDRKKKGISKILLKKYGIKKVIGLVPGGKERQDSVYNGVKALIDDGIVLVHDAARPFIE